MSLSALMIAWTYGVITGGFTVSAQPALAQSVLYPSRDSCDYMRCRPN